MNILLLTEHWLPQKGGVQRYLSGISQHLADEPGAVVSVLAPADKRFFYPFIKPAWLPLFIHVYRRVQREKIDVILCGKTLFEGLLAIYIKKYLGTPYIVFTYAMEIEEWAGKPATRRKLERALNGADRIVYINEVTKKRLLELGAKQSQLVKIQPGASLPLLFEEGLGEVTTRSYNITKPYIISIGRLIPRKGFDDLVAGFGKLNKEAFPNLRLVIIGDGPERHTLEQLAKEQTPRVQFLGAIPDEDMAALLYSSELFALVPKSAGGDVEGFGIVYLEAALAGLTSIGTRHGGVPEAVVHGETGLLVDEAAPEQVAQALEKLLLNENLRKDLGLKAQARAKQQFSWERQGGLVQDMLNDMLRGS